jgi:hypothetical protein
MTTTKRFSITAAILALALLSQPAHSTQIQRLSLKQLAQRSEFILTGQIIGIRYQVEQGQVWTVVRVAAEQSLKGRAAEYVFRVPGGEMTQGGRALVTRVEGVPVFQVLQRGVFFLGNRGPELPQPVGWEQGFRRIEIRNGREIVLAAASAPEDQSPMQLRDFLNLVEKARKEK